MINANLAGIGSIQVPDPELLVGLTDLQIAMTVAGPVLYAVARGGGSLIRFELGVSPGVATLVDSWDLPDNWRQLESTDLLVMPGGSGISYLFLAGLATSDLYGRVEDGSGFGPVLQYDAGSFDMGQISALESDAAGETVIATLNGGGLVQLDFGTGNDVTVQTPTGAGALQGEQASAVATLSHGGQEYAIVSYGAEDRVALLQANGTGDYVHVDDIGAEQGLWIAQPGAVTAITGPDGAAYVILAASGSDSLSVLRIEDGTLQPVYHMIDSLETRFADAAFVEAVEIGGQVYVVAAGSDQGLSVMALLPGGQLIEVATIAASLDTPLNGLSALEVYVDGNSLRIFVSTQAEPYLVEFEFSLENPGLTQIGGAGADDLQGGAGDDMLFGDAGNDQLAGGAGNDILMDGAGSDTLRGQAGADTFIFSADGALDSIMDYQPGVDQIVLQTLDLVIGIEDVQIISQSWGAELRIGDEVLYVFSADGSRLWASDFEGDAIRIDGGIAVDPSLYPDPGPDLGPEVGNTLDNTLFGGPLPASPQELAAPGISPTVPNPYSGGSGADTITAGTGDDQIVGGAGDDFLSGGDGQDILLGDGGFDEIMGGFGNDSIYGGAQADYLDGGGGNDVIVGGDGFDNIYGQGGNDMMWGGSGPDRLYGGGGDDWISAGSNFGFTVDGIDGGAGNDTLLGNAGFDLLIGGAGDDVIDGGHQADNLFGDGGDDVLFGNLGFDRLFGGDGNDQLAGGDGPDSHFGQRGNDTMWGGPGEDRFFGGRDNDIIFGGEGNDTLGGNAGFDTLIGGAGDDELWGDFNADRFVFADGHGHDVIFGFDALNPFEVLDFSGLSLFGATTDVMLSAIQDGNDVLIDTGPDSSILLVNVDLADLDGLDFLF